jgi:hypothetical protein
MAGFEIVVRPAVFPDIRPAPAQPVPPADDPAQGFATIRGNGAKTVGLSYSYSSSISSSQRTETKRREDEVRVYQKDEDETVNKKNFVDIRVANKIWTKGPPDRSVKQKPGPEGPMTGDDLSGYTYTPGSNTNFYTRVQEKDNIEILRKNIIRTSDGQET